MNEFDCPKKDSKVSKDDCRACNYFMIAEICGYLKDGKRGGGKDGEDIYISEKATLDGLET